MKKVLAFAFLSFFLTNICFGQHSVQSQIFDADTKQSIPMANVRLVGTTQGTLTNVDGKFSISVAKNHQKIAVSYVGYDSQVFEAKDFPKSIFLKTSTLNEVVVMPDSMLRILMKNAYNSIEKNYPQDCMRLIGFYRETIANKKDSAFYYYSENQIDVLKPAYKKQNDNETGQVKVLKSRTEKLPEFDKLGGRLYGGPFLAIDADNVQRRSWFLKPENYAKAYFTLKSILKYDGRDTYWVEIVPRKDSIASINVFIDKQTLAYTKMEIIVDKSDKNQQYELGTKVLLYERQGNQWYLKAMQYKQKGRKFANKVLNLSAEFVTTNIRTDSLNAFGFDEQLDFTASISNLENNGTISTQEKIEGLETPDLAQKQFKSLYSASYIDSLQPKPMYKVEASDIQKHEDSKFDKWFTKQLDKLSFNMASFYVMPFKANVGNFGITMFNNDLASNVSAGNAFTATWNFKYKFQFNKRWALNYTVSKVTISQNLNQNNYGSEIKEFDLNYRLAVNRAKSPIYIQPMVGVMQNKSSVSFGSFDNRYDWSSMTNTKMDASKVRVSLFEKSLNLEAGLDFNFRLTGIRHLKVGVRYSNPVWFSDKKIEVKEIEKSPFKKDRSFELPVTDSRLKVNGLNNFQSQNSMLWLHLSYNWGK